MSNDLRGGSMIVFKTFSLGNKKYLYDRSTNKIICIDDKSYKEFEKIEKEGGCIENFVDIEPYKDKGLLLDNTIREINYPAINLLDNYLDSKMEQLILQVTQQCNLRCSYCVYSGNYFNREHTNQIMSEEVAFKAIDYFIQHSQDSDEIVIGFYGGEPLLNFSLIKKSVGYVKNKVGDRRIRFSMTTNGTLFNDEVNKFLEKNNFSILVSLDGTRDEHNKNRCFSDGKGSFDILIKNLTYIFDKYPDLYKKISFNTVLNTNHNYTKVKSFFEKTDILKNSIMHTNIVESKNSKIDVLFSEDFHIARRYDYLLFILFLMGKVHSDVVSKLIRENKAEIDSTYKSMCLFRGFSETYHHGGPCIPGVRRLFVSVDGKFYPCERVSETSEIMNIGDLKNGINIQKCKTIMNIGKITEEECKVCWALFFCKMCIAEIEKNGETSKKTKCQNCTINKRVALETLKEITLLKEYGYTFGMEEN